MTINAFLIGPLLAMVLLTFAVVVRTFLVRVRAIKRREITVGYFRARLGDANEAVLTPAQNLQNLFEFPVLFYLLYVIQLQQGSFDGIQLGLAWAFVAFRYVHTLIHLSYNNVLHRLRAFAGSLLVLVVMWGRFVWGLVG